MRGETDPLLQRKSPLKPPGLAVRRLTRHTLILSILLALMFLGVKLALLAITTTELAAVPEVQHPSSINPLNNQCLQAAEIQPSPNPQLDRLLLDEGQGGLFRSNAYKSQVASHLSAAVQIPTQCFDDVNEGGKERYAGFLKFHAWLETTYPVSEEGGVADTHEI